MTIKGLISLIKQQFFLSAKEFDFLLWRFKQM